MPDIYTFIDTELRKFHDKDIYDTELKYHCIKLNEYLNKVIIDNYDEHLRKNRADIHKEMKDISNAFHKYLYIDFSEIYELLYEFQRDKQIPSRDHYYHSIQCFLLSIALLNTLKRPEAKQNDIILKLYLLTLYHDIGYIYYNNIVTSDTINDTLAEYFTCKNVIIKGKALYSLCIENDLSQVNYSNGLERLVEKIKSSIDIQELWSSISNESNNYLCSIADIDTFPIDVKKHHSYYSALLFAKALQTKNIIGNYYYSILIEDKDEGLFEKQIRKNKNKEELLRKIVKSIFLHDFDDMKLLISHLLSISTDFLSAYLIIIDELQTYGRQLGNDPKRKKALINPRDVGFEWDLSKNKLILTKDPTMQRKYSAHSNTKIRKILSKKIDATSLQYL
ncbi:hypothetical protein AGMMS50268_30170 [Spirochaetia bacterium]|nr:hypothetical protein AGMMS50268_30170 [Spirochaetia bacterium]